MKGLPDIDIDVKDRAACLESAPFVQASLIHDEKLVKHPTGVFFQRVPADPLTGLSAFPSGKEDGDVAGQLGYYKFDLIPNHAYDRVRGPAHLDELMSRTVDWSMFQRGEVVRRLQQLGKHESLLAAYPPTCVGDLAVLIAVIRPGKMHLIGEPWSTVEHEVWKKDPDGAYGYKKSHAVAFALCIVAQLQSLIEAGEIE